MSDPTFAPPTPSKPTGRSFLQTLTLGTSSDPLAVATWYTTGHPDGVFQIVDFWVAPPGRRRGVGSQLLKAVVVRVNEYAASQKIRPRRLWTAVEQKDQIVSRAFLTTHGFHHTASHGELYKNQELLLYSKAMD